MTTKHLSAEVRLKAEFYDVDSLKIVWHGNYVKYMEQARCALMAFIGYNYQQMEESGYGWPIVNLQLKYIKPIFYNQEFIVRATLLEHEHRIKISYQMIDAVSGEILNKSESIQMGIDLKTGKSIIVSPACLINAVTARLNQKEKYECFGLIPE
jgi:acyl-CoA thioester hydrolase